MARPDINTGPVRRTTGAARSMLALVVATVALSVAVPGPAYADSAGEENLAAAMVNDVRAAAGVATLEQDGELQYVARAWAQRMADGSFLAHNADLPYSISLGWWMWGENVGRGGSVGRIHDALVASPTHYANLVESQFTHVGVGVAFGADGRIYLAQAFGAW